MQMPNVKTFKESRIHLPHSKQRRKQVIQMKAFKE